jgi:glucose/arabinose dehydrogenase
VVRLADRDGDGFAEEATPLLTGLTVAHGLAFAGNVLFVAETNKVLRLDPWNDPSTAREIIHLPAGADIPGNPNHQTRSLAVGPDDKLYVSIGSFCDACTETDPMRGAIWRYNLDGSGGELYATGVRNAVGMTFEPGTNRLWVTENGSNELGDDIPPDEINITQQVGADYGWPYCYGDRVVQLPLGTPERCANTVPAALNLPAHVAPLGLAFYSGAQFPAEYRGDLFVALHGSAVLDDPIGYKLVRVPIRDGQPQEPVEFVRGWLRGRSAWGRPVMPMVGSDGSLYLTDDKTGVIYRIRADAQ